MCYSLVSHSKGLMRTHCLQDVWNNDSPCIVLYIIYLCMRGDSNDSIFFKNMERDLRCRQMPDQILFSLALTVNQRWNERYSNAQIVVSLRNGNFCTSSWIVSRRMVLEKGDSFTEQR